MLNYLETPKIENGYLFEQNKGWFGVIKPTYKENYITNPHFANFSQPENFTWYGLPDYRTEGVYEPSSFYLTPIGGSAIAGYVIDKLDGLFTFSCYVKSTNGTKNATISLRQLNNPNKIYLQKNITITTEFERVFLTFSSEDDSVDKEVVIESDTTMYITSLQFEDDYLTTFIYGDMDTGIYKGDDAYRWTGKANASSSIRTEAAYSGGEIISLHELGFKLSEFGGLGYPNLTPTLFEQAMLDTDLYTCSIPDQREIELTGFINGAGYKDLSIVKGNIADLFYHLNRPIRVVFTPYEHCSDVTPCMYFDMLYTEGLNETVSSLYGEELTISGITLTPYINECNTYVLETKDVTDFMMKGAVANIFFLLEDGSAEDAGIPNYIGAGNYRRSTIIDATVYNNEIYVLLYQSVFGKEAVFYFAKYSRHTWTLLASSQLKGVTSSLDLKMGQFQTIEAVNGGPVNGVLVGGYFDSIETHNGVANASVRSLFLYNPEANRIETGYALSDYYYGDVGQVSDIVYDPVYNALYISGSFHKIALLSFKNEIYEYMNAVYITKGRAREFINIYNDDDNFGTTGGWLPKDGNKGVVYKIVPYKNYVYLLTNFHYDNVVDLTNDSPAFLYKYKFTDNGVLLNAQPCAYPFTYSKLCSLIDMVQYGTDDTFFITGFFTQATSDANNVSNIPNSSGENDYMVSVAAFDANGFNKTLNNFTGRFEPLSTKVEYVEDDQAFGIFGTNVNKISAPFWADRAYATISKLNNSIFLSGNIYAYGDINDKTTAYGLVEYIPTSQTDLSSGFFVPSYMQVYMPNKAISPWSKLITFNTTSQIKGIFSTDTNNPDIDDKAQLIYNNGIEVSDCATYVDNNNVTMILQARNGIISEISGIRNLTTNKAIFFEPFDSKSIDIIRFTYLNNTLHAVSDKNGNIAINEIYNSGNPLSISPGDRVQLICNMGQTILNNKSNVKSTITLKYIPGYASANEMLTCN